MCPSPRRDHVGQKGPEAVHDTAEVDLEDPVHVVVGHVGEALQRRRAGVGEEQRDPPERLVRGAPHLGDRCALADVACDTERGPAVFADLACHRLGPVRHEVTDGDHRSFRGERSRQAAPDAAAASGDDRDPPRDFGHTGARAGSSRP